MKRRSPSWKQSRSSQWRPVLLEEDVIEEITRRLWWEYHIKVYRVRERIPGKGKLSEAGIPDLIGWVQNGLETPWPLFIECKRPGGARRTAQIQFIEKAKADGCVAFFASSWDKVVTMLDAVGIRGQRRAA